MLDLSRVDLGQLVSALDDHSGYGTWWIDVGTGEVRLRLADSDDDPAWDPDSRADARRIEPLPSGAGYGDMADFIHLVADRHAADLLSRAIGGRGAFRRFKDTLMGFPELRDAWFRFSDTRMQRRAIEFLLDEGLVAEAEAERAIARLGDPPLPGGDGEGTPREVAAAVAADLRRLYGARLVDVVLYGSRARGDAHEDSDVDLAVIIDRMTSPWEELRRMDDILWRHTLSSGLTISATPVSPAAWQAAERPLLRTAKADGIRVG